MSQPSAPTSSEGCSVLKPRSRSRSRTRSRFRSTNGSKSRSRSRESDKRRRVDLDLDLALDKDANTGRLDLPMNLWRLSSIINTDEKVIEFSQAHGLLPYYSWCPTCHNRLQPYKKVNRKGRPPYYRFLCNSRACRKASTPSEVGLKKGTWFEGAKISMQKSLVLAYCFSQNFTNHQAVNESSFEDVTSTETVVDFFNYCREVCVECLFNGPETKQIGGPKYTIEIDEAKFGRRKFSHGRLVEGQWVLGGICRETKECFLVPVEDRTETTLIGLIKRHVRVGSVIHTDCVPTYNRLSEEGYTHLSVNRTANFVDPETGACTNLIGSTWWAIRRGLPNNCAYKKFFAGYLAEYIWRKRNRGGDLFLALLRDISKVYPGPVQ